MPGQQLSLPWWQHSALWRKPDEPGPERRKEPEPARTASPGTEKSGNWHHPFFAYSSQCQRHRPILRSHKISCSAKNTRVLCQLLADTPILRRVPFIEAVYSGQGGTIVMRLSNRQKLQLWSYGDSACLVPFTFLQIQFSLVLKYQNSNRLLKHTGWFVCCAPGLNVLYGGNFFVF